MMIKSSLWRALMIGGMSVLAVAHTEVSKAQQSALLDRTKLQGWHLLDKERDGYMGISLDKAKEQYLNGKPSHKVLVAVIDAGVDTAHAGLKERLWHNPKEEAGNGVDDDKNGYVDDVYGWNFLGRTNDPSVNVDKDSYEFQRIYFRDKAKFENISNAAALKGREKADYEQWLRAKELTLDKNEGAGQEKEQLLMLQQFFGRADSLLRRHIAPTYGIAEVDTVKLDGASQEMMASVNLLKMLIEGLGGGVDNQGIPSKLDEMLADAENNASALPDSVPNYRGNVVNDNYYDFKDRYYGNTNVNAGDVMHGTHVAGIIGGIPQDNGARGVVDNVELMTIRAVPDGDEHDKDVANAIRYAVDNGASIINMSFGKAISPEEEEVQKAIQHATKKGVLIVHAAGNENSNIDTAYNFPRSIYKGKRIPNYISVGASTDTSFTRDKLLVAPFSNYGKERVDVFAPGVLIYATVPGGDYQFLQGTSMASPVVAGLAALLKSYYPKLKAKELKALIEDSAVRVDYLSPVNGVGDQVSLGDISRTGGIVNAYEAFKLAEDRYGAIK
ncbi:S8 family serine peptidase [Olivibacter sitiensis]|uniref:S8 family serine peptidase n=1 Tax=Olivibacter sitiensis TaxID=376470 RepID=UPI00040206A9|nr:S8 family serine peptidase [Olivibacter sitiensis]